MYVRGDIFISPSYPLYFGIGNKRFEERVKAITEKLLSEIDKFYVKTISVNNIDIPKDKEGNVNLDVPTNKDIEDLKKEISESIDELKKETKDSLDKLKNETNDSIEKLKNEINSSINELKDAYKELNLALTGITKDIGELKESISDLKKFSYVYSIDLNSSDAMALPVGSYAIHTGNTDSKYRQGFVYRKTSEAWMSMLVMNVIQ